TGGRVSLTGGDLSVFINALRTDSRFNVLSTPRIFTTNNQQAQINISQSIPYVLSTRQDTLGGIQYNYDFLDVGIVLTVTPRITANGYVTMDVNQTANELQSFTSFNAPIVNQREANTTVSVLDGETVVLGGIIRNAVTATTNKVPILGDLPLLGNIFRSTTKQNSKTELLVLLRPRIVRDDAEARALRRDSTDRLSLPTREQLKKVLPPEDGPITNPTEPDKDPGSGAGAPIGKDPAKPKETEKPPTDPNKKTPPPSTPK
ncbi:type II secretion system protein GspD, partial [bacterium]